MKNVTVRKVLGWISMFVGALTMAGLVFFYSTILFSDKWEALEATQEQFRLIFNIPSGIVVIYALFLIFFIPAFLLFCFGAFLALRKKYVGKYVVALLGCIWVIAIAFASITTVSQVQKILDRISPFSTDPVAFDVESEIPIAVEYVFRTTLRNEVKAKVGMPAGGHEPYMFLETFPGLTMTDFENVEASIGRYTVESGKLVHKMDESQLIHNAAKSVTDRGLDTLLANVSIRLGINLTEDGTITEVMEALLQTPTSAPTDIPSDTVNPSPLPKNPGGAPVACTMDAKICPDGSAVGRQGPDCEFSACPVAVVPKAYTCTPSDKEVHVCTMEFAPVCALVEVQCIKAPCPPIPKTFDNGCGACAQGNVTSYTQGECKV